MDYGHGHGHGSTWQNHCALMRIEIQPHYCFFQVHNLIGLNQNTDW